MSTYIVEGMTCGGCVRSVTSALERALPQARVEVELETKRVRIEGRHEVDAVRQAVEDAGFEFAGPAA